MQLLTIELLDLAVDSCSLPLHNQVASKDFTSTISQLTRNRETPQLTREKLAGLVQKWAFKFEHSQDILPGFSELYQILKASGVSFPAEPVEAKRQRYTNESATYAPSSSSGERRSLPPQRLDKLKRDLGVVQENIELTNEIIDASDPRDDATRNDILCQLVATLRAMESKLMKLISGVDDDELIDISIEIKDKVEFTLQRFDDLRHGRRPEPNRLNKKPRDSGKRDKEPEPSAQPTVEGKTSLPDLMGVDLVTGPAVEEPFDPFADVPVAKPKQPGFNAQFPASFPSVPSPPLLTTNPAQFLSNPSQGTPVHSLQTIQPPQIVSTQPFQTAPAAYTSLPPAVQYDPMKAMFGSSFPSQSYTASPFATLSQQSYPPQANYPPQPSYIAQPGYTPSTQASSDVKVKHNMGYVQEEHKQEQKTKPEFHDLFSLEKI